MSVKEGLSYRGPDRAGLSQVAFEFNLPAPRVLVARSGPGKLEKHLGRAGKRFLGKLWRKLRIVEFGQPGIEDLQLVGRRIHEADPPPPSSPKA